MQRHSSRKIDYASTVLLYAAPVAGVGIFCLFQKGNLISGLSNIVVTLILAGIYYTFLHVNENYFYGKIKRPLLYFGSFFLSFLLLGASVGVSLGAFWMFAVVCAALSSGMELALATHAVLMVQYALLLLPRDDGFYRFLAYILLGLVLSLLFSQLKEKRVVPYLALILVACNGVLQCVVYQFNLVKMSSQAVEIMMEMFSLLVFVGIGYIYLIQCEKAGQKGNRETEAVQEAVTATEEKSEVPQPSGMGGGAMVLSRFVEPGFELLERLREYSEALHMHSSRIGELSEKAAHAVGGDALLAKAGGLYHEIGRITGEEDYIEAGTRIGQEYGFPEELLAVMRQHSTGFELPKSIEAAVVMLSDCIISTSDYLAKNGKRDKISDRQLVTSIFHNRLDKGNLEQSGMTMEQLEALKKFYIENTFVEQQAP